MNSNGRNTKILYLLSTFLFAAILLLGMGWLFRATPVLGMVEDSTANTDPLPMRSVATCSITVMNADNAGTGSLRQALLDICSGGLITFHNTLIGSTIPLTSELDIDTDVTISGTVPITISGSSSVRVFDVQPNRQVTFDSLTIADSNYSGSDCGSSFSAACGGGVMIKAGATVTVSNSTLTGNMADFGGGIFIEGSTVTVTVSNSTLSGNTATSLGGGIFNNNGTTVTVSNSTLSGNNGSGIYNTNAGTVMVSNSIIANSTSGGDCSGTINSLGYNLNSDNSCGLSATGDITNTNPLLMPLGDYGGPTLTHLPLAGSPVIDAGDPTFVPPPYTDQRGDPRAIGRLDIGAVEACGNAITVMKANNAGAESLRQALLDVCSGGLITFDNSLSGGTIPLTSELDIDTDVTISGTVSITISGSSSVRVFDVQPNRNVTLDSLTIADGNMSDTGGGIRNSGTLTLTSSSVISNTATNGGGIFNTSGGTVMVSNSTLAGNTASSQGGGIINFLGTVTVSNSTIAGNTANILGGGIFTFGGTVTVNNSIIANSTSGGDCSSTINSLGYNLDSDNSCGLNATGDITNTNPLLLPLGDYGGLTNTHLPMAGSPVIDAGDPAFVPPPATDQRGEPRVINTLLDMGAIEWSCSDAINVLNAGDAGVGSLRQALLEVCPGGLITFDNDLSGSTIPLSSELDIDTDVTISGTVPITISGNSSVRVFDVLANRQVTFDALTIAAGNYNGSDCGSSGLFACGGGIMVKAGATVTVSNSTLLGNTANIFGGGIYNDGTVFLSNSTLSGNTANIFGGGIYNNSTITVSNSTLAGNTAANDGGGIYNNSTITVSNSIIADSTSGNDCDGDPINSLGYNLDSDNSCGLSATGDITNTDPSLMPLGDYGGPTWTHLPMASSPVLDAGDPTFMPPPATDQRGEPRVSNGRLDIGAVENLCSNAITVMNADNAGTDSLRQALLDICTGGLITFDNSLSGSTIPLTSELEINTDVTISGTVPITISGSSSVRVFDVLANHKVTFDSLTIADGNDSGNDCSGFSCGGGIMVKTGSAVTVTNGTLVSNMAALGGGIINLGTVTVTNSTLSGNTATFTGGGGGIYNLGSTVTISNSTFSGNTAPFGGGGGITNLRTVMISNSTFSSNTAATHGGSIFNTGTAAVHNSTLSGNMASFDGGGIFNESGTVTVSNSTLTGNTATRDGGGIYNGLTITVSNSIIANSINGTDCFGPINSLGYNLDSDNSCGLSATGDITNTNPLLLPLGDYGGATPTHALGVGSPAIDAGDATTCAAAPVNGSDQRGVSRPQNSDCDIGAYELWRLAITAVSPTDADLSWQDANTSCSYDVFESTTPYFTPVTPTYLNVTSAYTVNGRLGDTNTNYFFINRAMCSNSITAYSNEVGEFDFALEPGDP